MLYTPRYQLVELPIGAQVTQANAQVTFPQQPQLQSFYDPNYLVYVRSIDVFTIDSLALSPFTAGNPVASAQDITNTVLTLVRLGDEAHKFVPLAELSVFQTPSFTPFKRFPFLLPDEWTIDWTKSYVQMIAAPRTTPPFSFLFGVHYSYYPKNLMAGAKPR